MPNIDFETTTAGNAITTAEPNVSAVYGTVTAVADSGVRGSNAMQSNLSAFNVVTQEFTAVSEIWIRAYFRVNGAVTANTLFMEARHAAGGGEHIGELQLNTSRQIRLRDESTLTATSTTALTTNTWYRLEWHLAPGSPGTQELRIYDGPHSTTILETVNGTCSNSQNKVIAQILIGASSAGSNTDVRYDDVDYSDTTWLGPSASTDVASYDLTITHTTDLASVSARTYEVDAASSTGTTSLSQLSGPTLGTITESPTGVFTFADPGAGDMSDLGMRLTAGSDTLDFTIPRSSGGYQEELTFYGGTVGLLSNWG